MSKQKKNTRPAKRDCSGKIKISDEHIDNWLEELNEGAISDGDDTPEDSGDEVNSNITENLYQNIIDTSESESESDLSEDEEKLSYKKSSSKSRGNAKTSYIGRNGFEWSKTEIPRISTTPAHNVTQVPQKKKSVVYKNFEELWSKFFDSEMISNIVSYTNKKLKFYRRKWQNTNRQELKDTNETELRSLFGILYYTAVFKSNTADASNVFATDGTSHEIFRCVMSKHRFCTLLNSLRFDNSVDRQKRLKYDPLASISWIFDKFVKNSQQNYVLGRNACIDEMYIPFSGRCRYIIYVPKSPSLYGLKIVILSDSETQYAYNAYIYSGKDSDGKGLSEEEKKLEAPTQSALRLIKPIEKSNRNIIADSRFSSTELMEILKTKNLTYLGTIKKTKREIPLQFKPNKTREPGSSLYGFTEDYTLLSYVPKKNKAIILISSYHHEKSTDEKTQKPTMIVDYNQSKGELDEIKKKCLIYSCNRKTDRWTMAIFYRIIDLAGLNAWVLFQSRPGVKLRRNDFLLSLARDLVLTSLKERVYNERLPRELRLTIKRVLGKDLPPPHIETQPEGPSRRKMCSICPSKLRRQTRFTCCACSRSICLQCASQICADCKY